MTTYNETWPYSHPILMAATLFCWGLWNKRSVSHSLKPRPNDRNMPTQHIATMGATCCVHLATVLRCVATCWVLLAQVWNWSNLSQQHPTCRNTVAKRTQHVAPNNVAICCVGMLRSFGRGFISSSSVLPPLLWENTSIYLTIIYRNGGE